MTVAPTRIGLLITFAAMAQGHPAKRLIRRWSMAERQICRRRLTALRLSIDADRQAIGGSSCRISDTAR